MGRFIDLRGQRFGRWTVLARSKQRGETRTRWLCRCDDGVERVVFGNDLRRGNSKSCGCLRRETTIKRNTKHGHARVGKYTRAYYCWQNMLRRCFNPNHHHYPYYGERGITVCKRWLIFENFLADMGEPPPGMTIDRIDNDGNYEPGNCKWSTPAEQTHNRRPRKRKARRAKLAEINAYAVALAHVAPVHETRDEK
jgi:pentatricopeptide repeat protein